MPPRVFGLMVACDEGDILPLQLRHHLSQGIERFIVVDNGSTDDTPDVLSSFPEVIWTREPGDYDQATVLNRQVAQARELGAEWVVPLDADEFWTGVDARVADVLSASNESLVVEFRHFVQRRDSSSPLTMTRRCLLQGVPPKFAAVEMAMPPKRISPVYDLRPFLRGGHGPPQVNTDRIVCLHAFIRSRSVLEKKARWGARKSWTPLYGRRWSSILSAGSLDAEWELNTYWEHGRLGNGHPTFEDLSLVRSFQC